MKNFFTNIIAFFTTKNLELDFAKAKNALTKLVNKHQLKDPEVEIELHDADGIAVTHARGRRYIWGSNMADALPIEISQKTPDVKRYVSGIVFIH